MNRTVGWVLALSLAFLGAFDLFMMVKFGPYQTVSWFVWTVTQEYPIIPLLVGIPIGHFWFPMKGLIDKETLEVLKFYADPRSWRKEPDKDFARQIDACDLSEYPGHAKFCGGRKARELLRGKGML